MHGPRIKFCKGGGGAKTQKITSTPNKEKIGLLHKENGPIIEKKIPHVEKMDLHKEKKDPPHRDFWGGERLLLQPTDTCWAYMSVVRTQLQYTIY